MKHINITNWQGNITDWTKFNYVYGGLDDTLADRVNLRIPGTNLRNYIKKSDNLVALENGTITASGLTFTIQNGKISSSGTPSGTGWIRIKSINLDIGTYSYTDFTSANSKVYLINTSYVQLTDTFTVTSASTYYIAVLGRSITNNGQLNNSSLMLVKGSTVPTTYEPYGSMVLVENVDSNLQPLNPPKITVFNQVDLGSLNYERTQWGQNYVFQAKVDDMAKTPTNNVNLSCPKYSTVRENYLYSHVTDKVIANNTTASMNLKIVDNAYTDATAFKTAIKGVIMLYEPASQSNANTLSMASPMKLSNELEETVFNEQIEESVE